MENPGVTIFRNTDQTVTIWDSLINKFITYPRNFANAAAMALPAGAGAWACERC